MSQIEVAVHNYSYILGSRRRPRSCLAVRYYYNYSVSSTCTLVNGRIQIHMYACTIIIYTICGGSLSNTNNNIIR